MSKARKPKAKSPALKKPTINRDLQERQLPIMAPVEVEEEPEAEPEPPKPSQMPTVPADLLIQCMGPQSLEGLRCNRIKAMAKTAITTILDDLTDEMAFNPNAAQYTTELDGNMPIDMVALIVASLNNAGWDVTIYRERVVVIQLPLVKLAIADIPITQISTVQPL